MRVGPEVSQLRRYGVRGTFSADLNARSSDLAPVGRGVMFATLQECWVRSSVAVLPNRGPMADIERFTPIYPRSLISLKPRFQTQISSPAARPENQGHQNSNQYNKSKYLDNFRNHNQPGVIAEFIQQPDKSTIFD